MFQPFDVSLGNANHNWLCNCKEGTMKKLVVRINCDEQQEGVHSVINRQYEHTVLQRMSKEGLYQRVHCR